MDNQNNKKNKMEKYKKELIESYEKIAELENIIVNEQNKYNDLFSENRILQEDIIDKNSLVIEIEEKLFELKINYEKDKLQFEKLVDDLKIKIKDNKLLLNQKNDLILKLENTISTLQFNLKKIELQSSLKNTKQNKKDLLVPLLECVNDDENIFLKNKMYKYEEKIKELEKNLKQKETTLLDDIYISDKENKLENIKKDLKIMYEEKNILEKQLFELKSMVQILEIDDKGIKSENKFCCFM